MKKILLVIAIMSFLIPASLFAKSPSDQEVKDATVAVMTVFAMVFMSSMMGTAPENVTVDSDMSTGNSTMVFNDFNVASFVDSMSAMMDSMDGGEKPVFAFNHMSGTIAVNELGDLIADVSLKGGNVETLKIKTNDEDLLSLNANGKDFSYLDQVFTE